MAPFEAVEGTSFPLTFKLVATAMVAALGGFAMANFDDLSAAGLPRGALVVALGLAAIVAWGYGAILGSRTSIDGTRIRQRWLWGREVAIADITQVKLIHLRGLAWLIAPRLVVRARGVVAITFHSAAPEVLEAFRALAYGKE